MKILIVNDDGVFSDGIKMLADVLSKGNDVTVCAPENEMSGNSHAISFFKEISARQVDIGVNVTAYAIGGTPVDCVRYGVHHLLKDKVDLVVSGINNLPNLGTDTIYSATVNAALEASILGISAIAVSTVAFSEEEFLYSANFIQKNLNKLISLFPVGTIANVNVPAGDETDICGVSVVPLGISKYDDHYKEIAGENSTSYMLVGAPLKVEENPEDCDVEKFAKGFITITPMAVQLTHFELLESLKDSFK